MNLCGREGREGEGEGGREGGEGGRDGGGREGSSINAVKTCLEVKIYDLPRMNHACGS